jgi:hypothetical protein
MLIKKMKDIPYSEITPKSAYLNRRTFMTGAAALGVAGLLDPRQRMADATTLQTVKSSHSFYQWVDADFLQRHHQLQQFL